MLYDPLTGEPHAGKPTWLGPTALQHATVLYHPATGQEIEVNGHEHERLYNKKQLGGPYPLTRRPSTRAPRKSNLKRRRIGTPVTGKFRTKTAVRQVQNTWYKAWVPVQVLDDPQDPAVEILVYPVGYEPVSVLRRCKVRLRDVEPLPAKWTPVQYEHRP